MINGSIIMHIHDVSSNPRTFLKDVYHTVLEIIAAAEKVHSLNNRSKKTDSV